jgi:hypothetical protein
LASDKTRIILKGSTEFDELVDVEDDVYISNIEDIIARGAHEEIEKAIPEIFRRLEIQASPKGDDRKFRAYANRLLQIGEFQEFGDHVINKLVPFVVVRMESHPNRSDYWTKLLQSAPDGDWLEMAKQLLQEDPSVYNWQRFYVWRLLTARSDIPEPFKRLALSTVMSPISDLEAAQAIVCYGKHASNQQREALYAQHFSPQKSYPIQRAILIAIQEMHPQARGKLYKRAFTICPEHTQLVQYLEELESQKYGIVKRTVRKLPEKPRVIETAIERGVGKVKGKVIKYRLSRKDYDYE